MQMKYKEYWQEQLFNNTIITS